MTFALYEIAHDHEIQDKIREEINHVLKKHDGQICYDSIMDMKYLHQVIEETLRKYPPVAMINRECVKDYKVPDENLTIKKGDKVTIHIKAIHHDEEYYPNPSVFDPERFSPENKQLIPEMAYMPFGEGPRICIGLRFGLMQTKVGLVNLLKNFKFSVNKKTQEPLVMAPKSFILSASGGIWLDVHKL